MLKDLVSAAHASGQKTKIVLSVGKHTVGLAHSFGLVFMRRGQAVGEAVNISRRQ